MPERRRADIKSSCDPRVKARISSIRGSCQGLFNRLNLIPTIRAWQHQNTLPRQGNGSGTDNELVNARTAAISFD